MSETPRNSILVGDCIEQMRLIPAGVAHVCITSPPYFALRRYLPADHPDKDKEIGSEPTPEAFCATMVEVFRGVRRVLRDDGVLVCNLGDSYTGVGGPGAQDGGPIGKTAAQAIEGVSLRKTHLPDGNQLLIPHRVAMALQADGWVLRSTVVWAKKSPMPESIAGWRWSRCRVKVEAAPRGGRADTEARSGKPMADHAGRDFAGTKWAPCPGCPKCEPNGGLVLRRGKWRPTNGHEYIFVFSKGGDYFCDSEAVAEKALNNCVGRTAGAKADGQQKTNLANGWATSHGSETRNPRSVLSFPNEPFKGKHFATYPSSLPKFFIEAATSKAGCCPTCGACHAPIVTSERVPTRPGINNANDESGMANLDPQRHIVRKTVQGYRQTCKCPPAPPVPCLVFDPFMGSGTTARAAKWLGRDWLGCELNPEYAAMACERIEQPPKWATAQPKRAKRRPQPERLLF